MKFIFAAALFAAFQQPSFADTICTVFVTEQVFDGDFTNDGVPTEDPIVNANQECQTLADDADLKGEFKAWLSTTSYSPATDFAMCDQYVLPGGAPSVAAGGFPDLTDGMIDHAINEFANGTVDSADLSLIWTGTNSSGFYDVDGGACNDWTSGNDTGVLGWGQDVTLWTDFAVSSSQCPNVGRIYCFQQAPFEPAGANGDPHFKTWHGHHFDFHGECDLVLLQSKEFESGLGLDVHIRTHMRRDMSYISSAALRMGKHLLEVQSRGVYYLNGVAGADLPSEFGGFEFLHTRPTDKQHVFEVHLGGRQRIKVKTYKDFVSVLFEQAELKHFGKSVGLMGDFGTGRMISRDGKSVIDDANAFGQEWQVLDTEPSLFQTVRFPQHPTACTMPTPVQASQLRRRLSESPVDELAAEKACEHWGEGKDDCVFDVLTTGDLEMAMVGAY
jgi:hypothetical protein